MIMETLKKLQEKLNKLNKERNTLYNEIIELKQQEAFKKFNIGECVIDTDCNDFKKITAIRDTFFYSICVDEKSICEDWSSLDDLKGWVKITSKQFDSIFNAVLKDIQNPKLEDKKDSNWTVTFKSIVESINKK